MNLRQAVTASSRLDHGLRPDDRGLSRVVSCRLDFLRRSTLNLEIEMGNGLWRCLAVLEYYTLHFEVYFSKNYFLSGKNIT